MKSTHFYTVFTHVRRNNNTYIAFKRLHCIFGPAGRCSVFYKLRCCSLRLPGTPVAAARQSPLASHSNQDPCQLGRKYSSFLVLHFFFDFHSASSAQTTPSKLLQLNPQPSHFPNSGEIQFTHCQVDIPMMLITSLACLVFS